MPTYGPPETALLHPPPEGIARRWQAMRMLENRLQAHRAEEARRSRTCDHHFVPEAGTHEDLPLLESGVRFGGTLTGQGAASSLSFMLRCTKCPASASASVTERCPACATELSGRWIPHLMQGPGSGSFVRNQAWLASCPSCGFTTLALTPPGMATGT